MFFFWVVTQCRTICFSALGQSQVSSILNAVRTSSAEFVLHAGYLKHITQIEE
jgi:hypothetical protein